MLYRVQNEDAYTTDTKVTSVNTRKRLHKLVEPISFYVHSVIQYSHCLGDFPFRAEVIVPAVLGTGQCIVWGTLQSAGRHPCHGGTGERERGETVNYGALSRE